MNYPWADLTYCILAITSLILFLIHWSCKKAQINSISLYRTFFQRYSFYIVNRDWLCLETHTVPARRHCHKSNPSFLCTVHSCYSEFQVCIHSIYCACCGDCVSLRNLTKVTGTWFLTIPLYVIVMYFTCMAKPSSILQSLQSLE